MLILAFESTAKAASAALVRDGRLLSQYSQCSGLTHSRTLLPMGEDMLKNAELSLRDVDLLAVAHGPGSFTGIRIGMAAAKGLAWGAGKPLCSVSTLEAVRVERMLNLFSLSFRRFSVLWTRGKLSLPSAMGR